MRTILHRKDLIIFPLTLHCSDDVYLRERGRLGEVAVKIITVIEFGVNDGGGSTGGCCGIVVRADTVKMTNMTTAVFVEKRWCSLYRSHNGRGAKRANDFW